MAQNIRQNIQITATDNTTRGFRSVEKNMTKMDRFLTRIQTTLLGFVGLNIAVNLTRDLIRISDVAAEMQAKMALVTSTIKEQNVATEELMKISLLSGSALEDNTVLFTRLARPMRAMGFATKETTDIVKLFAQGLRISGASVQESASVVRQFSQAMQSNSLRGEEFNSIMENGGRIAMALSDGLGVSMGALRAMSKEGELSATKVIKALQSQADAIDRENARLPLTIGRALENIKTQFVSFMQGNVDVNKNIADVINGIAQNMGVIIDTGVRLGKVAIASLILSIGKVTLAKSVAASAAKREAAIQAEIDAKALRVSTLKARTAAENALIEARASQGVLIAKQAELRATIAANTATLNRAKALASENIQLANTTKSASIKAAALARVSAAQTTIAAMTVANTKAETSLLKVTTSVTAAVTAETAAMLANSKAKAANIAANAGLATSSAAATGILGKLSAGWGKFADKIGLATGKNGKFAIGLGTTYTKGKALAPVLTRMAGAARLFGAAMFGLPGLVLLFAASFASKFVDVDVAIETVRMSLQKMMTSIIIVGDYLTAPWDLTPLKNWGDHMDAISAGSVARIDDIVAAREREKAGFTSIEQEKAALLEESNKARIRAESDLKKAQEERATAASKILKDEIELLDQLNGIETKRSDELIEGIELEADIRKSNLVAQIKNKEDHARAVAEIDNETSIKSNEILTDSLATQLDAVNEFFNDKINKAAGNIDEILELEVQYGEKSRDILDKQKDVIASTIRELISKRDAYARNAIDAEERILRIQTKGYDKLAELMSDRSDALSAFENSQRAQSQLEEARAELRRINALDEIKDAAEIAKRQDELAQKVIDLGFAEKDRAASLEENSLNELDAIRNRNDAAGLYEKILVQSENSSRAFADSQKDAANNATDDIVTQKQAFEDIQNEIASIDDLIAETRSMVLEINADSAYATIDTLSDEIDTLNRTVTVTVDTKEGTKPSSSSSSSSSSSTKSSPPPSSSSSSTKSNDNSVVTREAVIDDKDKGVTIYEVTPYDPLAYNTGGYIPREAKLEGYGGGDKVRALLEAGEYIIRKEAVRKLGTGTMDQINKGELPNEPIKRQYGGFVGNSSFDVKTKAQAYYDRRKRKWEDYRTQGSYAYTPGASTDETDKHYYRDKFIKRYSPKVLSFAAKLKDLDPKNYDNARRVLGNIDSTLDGFPTERSKGYIESLFAQLPSLIENGKAEKKRQDKIAKDEARAKKDAESKTKRGAEKAARSAASEAEKAARDKARAEKDAKREADKAARERARAADKAARDKERAERDAQRERDRSERARTRLAANARNAASRSNSSSDSSYKEYTRDNTLRDAANNKYRKYQDAFEQVDRYKTLPRRLDQPKGDCPECPTGNIDKVEITLNVGDNRTTGEFDDNSATRNLIDTLKRSRRI